MSLAIQNDEKKLQLLKDVFFKTATHEEFQLFVHACERTGLDPFMKQIYPVKRWDSTLKREAMTIQTGIDGYRLIAERTGCYAPGKEPTFAYEGGKVISATSYVKKLTKDGTWHEISATAFFDEYCQKNKEGNPTSMWAKMPHSQLAKCAESLAIRKAFPAELSGLYTKEEMDQSELPKEGNQIENGVNSEQKSPISKEQAEDLAKLLIDCDPNYIGNFWKFLKAQVKGLERLEEIPVDIYDRIKMGVKVQRDKHQKMLMEDRELAINE